MDEPGRGGRRLRLPRLRIENRAMTIVCSVLGALFLLLALVGVVGHFVTVARPRLLGVIAVSPYLEACSVLALVAFAAGRQWLGAGGAAVLLVIGVTVQAHLFLADDAAKSGRDLVVMTANLKIGQGSATDVVREVRRHHVDVLMIEELTPELLPRLAAAGLGRALPHRIVDARGGASGAGMWSHYPLSDVKHLDTFAFATVVARAAIPGVPRPVTLMVTHMPGPVPDSTAWRRDIARLPGALRSVAADADGPIVVGGDFNATPDTTQFRDALVDGYRDAVDQAGAGYTRTWPADRWYPPVIAIDHVLTRDAVATSADTIAIADTDHRALRVTVRLPR